MLIKRRALYSEVGQTADNTRRVGTIPVIRPAPTL